MHLKIEKKSPLTNGDSPKPEVATQLALAVAETLRQRHGSLVCELQRRWNSKRFSWTRYRGTVTASDAAEHVLSDIESKFKSEPHEEFLGVVARILCSIPVDELLASVGLPMH